MRQHDPPGCHCRACDDKGKPLDHRVNVRVAEIPKPYKDVSDLLSSEDGPARYEAMIREAKPGPSWMIGHIEDVRKHDLTTVTGTVAACEDMVDVLLGQSPIARGVYVRELAEKLDVPEREVRQTLNDVLKAREAHYAQHPADRPKPVPVWARDAL